MKLELKHIQHYSIGGDNAISITDGKEIKRVDGIYTFDNKKEFWFKSGGWNLHCDSWKPVIRPMSDLYKEIGSVVGIVELFKMYETRVFDMDKKYSVVFDTPIISYKWEVYDTIKKEEGILKYIRKTANMGDLVHSFRYDPDLRRFSMYDDTNRRPLGVAYQLDLFTYLFEHHFDVFGLIDKGIAIDINTVQI